MDVKRTRLLLFVPGIVHEKVLRKMGSAHTHCGKCIQTALCQQCLARLMKKADFLRIYVLMDEVWIHHCMAESKQHPRSGQKLASDKAKTVT